MIKEECSKINLTYSNDGDGRITSAMKEKEYLDLLTSRLQIRSPGIVIERPKERYWYDIRIMNIPMNLKLTTGGTDNAFNKVAILYTLSGVEVSKRNMNYNEFFKVLKELPRKTTRNPMTEYHYLVVNKQDGRLLLKSILDIHSYKSNPCNILQMNWTQEFRQIDYKIDESSYMQKTLALIKTIQVSVRQAISSMQEFATADLDSVFHS